MKKVFCTCFALNIKKYINIVLFSTKVEIKVKELIKSIENHLNDNRKGERLRNGVRVAIIGIFYLFSITVLLL